MYSKSNIAVFGTIVAAGLFVSLFIGKNDIVELFSWYGVVIFISAFRYLVNSFFLKRKNNVYINNWGNAYIFLSLVTSSTWGFVWFLVSNENDIGSLAIVGMFAMGISATPFSAYLVYKKAMLFFFVPIVSFVIINYLYIGGQYGISFALVFAVYSFVILRSSFPISQSMVESILVKYRLEDEIIERKKIESKLLRLSIMDDLTGLYNRRYFDESLYSELHSSQRRSIPTSLILFDIDNFKNFNDNYGHVNGDDCLHKVSQTIKNTLKREEDLTFRYGGEEIAVILPNTKVEDAKKIAELICLNIFNLNIEHKYSNVKDVEVLTVSAGVASIKATKDFKNTDLIEKSDRALYQAKRTGKNKVVSI